jgi:3'-phosphoadenosine 5'-phosphosulfate sulfotransferase (PAPS reductase)/FAD synthetase
MRNELEMTALIIPQFILVVALCFFLVQSYLASGKERSIYIVSLSSGVSSSVAAERTIAKFGRGNTACVFMDTLWEDEDNHRFMSDCSKRWGVPTVRLVDGHTPLQVAAKEKIIPNSFQAPCTRSLKIWPFLDYCKQWQDSGYAVTVIIGMDWKERHRMEAPTRNYGERGIAVEYPLLWKPYEVDMFATVRSWGIEPPRMYRQGYSHANCGGRCVKQGMGDWLRTLTHYPDRFDEVSNWEQGAREWRGEHAILKRGGQPYTLEQLRADRGGEAETPLFDHAGIVMDDTTFCACNAADPGPKND